MKESKTSPRKIKAAIREAEAVALRVEGLSFRAIAERLGYANPGSAYRAVMRGLERLFPTEKAEALRKLELARLDRLIQVLWPRVEEGDYDAIDRVLKVISLRARLLGLDKSKFEVELGVSRKPLRLVDLFPADMSTGGVNGNGNKS